MRILCCLVATGCMHEGVTISGALDGEFIGTPPSALAIAVVYSPEDADHEAVSTTVTAPYPASWVFEVPGPSWAALEDDAGFEKAGGSIWVAWPGTHGSREDGFGRELIQPSGYELVYLTESPGLTKVFGLDDLQKGWNLLQRQELTCDDRVDLGGGAYGWPAKYAALPITTPITVELGYEPGDPPTNCP